MNETRFARVSNLNQEMTINFYPPLKNDDVNFIALGDKLIAAFNEYAETPAIACEYEEKAIKNMPADYEAQHKYTHRTIFGSELTATFDKVGVRLQVKNGSMVFISAGAQDAIIAIKPSH